MSTYRSVIVGLTGIGAARKAESPGVPVYGQMASSHASAYHLHPQTEVTAVCDIREDALKDFKERWKDIWPEVRLYVDYREMLDKEEPDLVSVATPDHVHKDITLAAAEGSARAILCEKPIATRLEDADAMIEAAKKHNVLLSIEHTRRWVASYLKTREMVRSGELGPLRTVTAEMYGNRAMLFRNGTHIIDLVCFYAEANPQWVVAELEEGFEHFTEYEGDGGHDPKTDPSVSAYIHFENGVRGFFNAYKTQFMGSQVTLMCDKGRIEISDREARLVKSSSHFVWESANIPVENYRDQRQLAAVGELIDVLETGGELVSSGREARKTLELMLGMLKSHHAGNCRVDFPMG